MPHLAKSGLYTWLKKFHVSPRGGLRAELERVADSYGLHLTFHQFFRGYSVYVRLTKPQLEVLKAA